MSDRTFPGTPNLPVLARDAMLNLGFSPEFPAAVLQELPAIRLASDRLRANRSAPDLRALLWSSIDNPTSRDLDQIEFAERLPNGDIRILLGIADVDALVSKGSAADLHAAQNGTSIYLGVVTFPLFPPEISNDMTSLLQDQDRAAMIIDITLDARGAVSAASVSRGVVRNRAKLNYDSAGAWLENTGRAPELVENTPGLADQLHLQFEAAQQFHEERIRAGALEFESIEPQPVMAGQNVAGLHLERKNRARDLIENLMVATNSAIATFLESRHSPSIQRVVRTPERWLRIVALAGELGTQLPSTPDAVALAEFLARRRREDPEHFADLSLAIVKLIGAAEYVVLALGKETEGHFGLAVHDYTHATAPNRRYPDLITQRLLKAAIAGVPPPYSIGELEEIAARCNDRAKAARKIERLMRKIVAATFLSGRIGETFDALVTGVSPKGIYVRVSNPPVEGRVVRGEAGLDVGEKVRVRLVGTNPERGFIDFARAN
ncbi:MAG TPA: RNB domain-containing ribonuclease [Chthoniobacterales bacterium]|nr:RNB domain-containing ribonuclease [Chthoniobacterales bacterium]